MKENDLRPLRQQIDTVRTQVNEWSSVNPNELRQQIDELKADSARFQTQFDLALPEQARRYTESIVKQLEQGNEIVTYLPGVIKAVVASDSALVRLAGNRDYGIEQVVKKALDAEAVKGLDTAFSTSTVPENQKAVLSQVLDGAVRAAITSARDNFTARGG